MDIDFLFSVPVIIGLSVLSLGWFYFSTIKELKDVWNNFVKFGDTVGLPIQKPDIKFSSELPEINGKYKGFIIKVFPHKVRSGTSSKGKKIYYYTRMYVFIKGTDNFTMQISKEGFLEKAAKAFGGQDIQTGNADFDKKFWIKSTHPEIAKNILNDTVCSALMENRDSLKGLICVDANKIDYEESGFMTSSSMTERFLKFLDVSILLGNSIEKTLPSVKLEKQF